MASLLLKVWLFGARFWLSQYLGRQGHLVRQGCLDGARQRAGQHDVKQRPPDCRRKRRTFCSLYGFNYTWVEGLPWVPARPTLGSRFFSGL